MKSKKILILGSDFGTIEVVKEAHRRNMYVIVSDLMKTSPSKELADESWMISTTDIDLLEKKCKEENISAIMFGASDFNINNCRELCKKLDLPIYCNNDYSWKIARNKRKFKDLCKRIGAPIATDYIVSDNLKKEELAQINYPVVVKPCDKSGNRGMSFCNNEKELVEAYHKAREISSEKIIIERKLTGKEYNIHYALADGESTLLYFSSTHHEPDYSSNLYSFKVTTSEHLKQFIDEVDSKLKQVFKEAKCKEGIVWVDAIRDNDGHFYLLEMGYRFGGVMTYVPYKYVSNFNTISWMLDCSLGIKHKKEDLPMLSFPLTSVAASYHLFTKKSGMINKIDGLDELEKMDNVFIDLPKRSNNEVRYNVCMGLLGIYGETIEELCSTLKKINKYLKVRDKDNTNMFINYDDYDELIREYYSGMKQFNKEETVKDYDSNS